MINRFLHIDTVQQCAAMKFSYDFRNEYFITTGNLNAQLGTPDVNYLDIAFLKPLGILYTHGQFYLGNMLAGSYQYAGSVYGVQWDTSLPAPDCTRIGNLDLHVASNLPVHNAIVGGTMTDGGVFTPFSNQSDWTSETRDGSIGQVMVKFPKFYIRFETDGTINRVLVSKDPVVGFTEVPDFYISAYQATLDRTNLKLSSVVNTTTQYRGGTNNENWDGSYRSLLGMPVTNLDLTQFRTYARARFGNDHGACFAYPALKYLYWLYVVEYATLNSQKAYTSELTSEGYRKGGLGNGISTWVDTDWNSYNGYNPFVPCGYTDDLGNRTGVKDFTIYDGSGSVVKSFLTSETGVSGVCRYRGVELPFSHIWHHLDAILRDADNKSYYICDTPSKYASTITEDYRYLCTPANVNDYISSILFGADGDIIAMAGGGSSTSRYCDYMWNDATTNPNQVHSLHVGGGAYRGALCGLLCADALYAPSYRHAYRGSRLCFFQ
ncbi:MAG: hypothetical protein IKP73_04500 [Bacteroidales bacterium]|nr:hypothetical protein [Bacteroidales bacterium]